MNRIEVYLGLGSNEGDRERNIYTAISQLTEEIGLEPKSISKIIETEPWGFVCEQNFLNCVVRFDIPSFGQDKNLHALSLLSICKKIETKLGRNEVLQYGENGSRIYHSRPIDIDIILYGCEHIDLASLIVPHPLAHLRDFVRIPLLEVASKEIVETFPFIFLRND